LVIEFTNSDRLKQHINYRGQLFKEPTAIAALPFSNSVRFDPIFTVIT